MDRSSAENHRQALQKLDVARPLKVCRCRRPADAD